MQLKDELHYATTFMKYTKYTWDYSNLHPHNREKDLKEKNINVYFAAFFYGNC